MTLPSGNAFIAMLLMLIIGVGLGMLIMTSYHASVQAVVEAPQAAATPVLGSAVRPTPEPVAQEAPTPPAPDQYVGVIFARQLVDIAARSDGRVEAVYVHLGDHSNNSRQYAPRWKRPKNGSQSVRCVPPALGW